MSEYIVRMPPDMPYEIKAELNAWYVNSEPIVRCKDCKHAWETEGGALRCLGYLVDKWDYYNDEPSDGKDVYEADFCAWGERRDA